MPSLPLFTKLLSHYCSNFPVFALAKDLGSIQSNLSESVVFVLGLARTPVVQFETTDGNTESRYPFYQSRHYNASDGVSLVMLPKSLPSLNYLELLEIAEFLADFGNARSRAKDLDDKIISSARGVSESLVDLVSLTTRSVMGAMDITYDGKNLSDIMIFVKGMGSVSDSKISGYV
jgi:hypothetical protein